MFIPHRDRNGWCSSPDDGNIQVLVMAVARLATRYSTIQYKGPVMDTGCYVTLERYYNIIHIDDNM